MLRSVTKHDVESARGRMAEARRFVDESRRRASADESYLRGLAADLAALIEAQAQGKLFMFWADGQRQANWMRILVRYELGLRAHLRRLVAEHDASPSPSSRAFLFGRICEARRTLDTLQSPRRIHRAMNPHRRRQP